MKRSLNCLFSELEQIILCKDPSDKCKATRNVVKGFHKDHIEYKREPLEIPKPGYPMELRLVPPKELKRRGMGSQAGRNILMHAVAHIEFNAINLALDAAYRFIDQNINYYSDWLSIADDEARHFCMIRDYLNKNGCEYGDLPAHNGLWEMAVKTQHDIVARMALVPRVLEARGLDVTPGMIKKLEEVGDDDAVDILKVIYDDEIRHVEIGSKWYFHHCEQRNLEPKTTFIKLVERYMHGELRGPFNLSARLQAGFDEMEMADLNRRYDPKPGF